jgi:hypothetical protein
MSTPHLRRDPPKQQASPMRPKKRAGGNLEGHRQKRTKKTRPMPTPWPEEHKQIRQSAANNSLDPAIELLGDSLHDSSSSSNGQMLAPNAMQQRNRGLGQITSPKPVSNFAGRYHTNNVPYGSTTMTDSLSFVQPLPLYNSHTSTSSSVSASSTSSSNAQSISAVWQSAWPRLKKMGWTRRERGTRGYDFFRPFAIPSTAKYGQDKFRDEQNLLNGLTDTEFAEAMGKKASPSGNVIEEEEGRGQDDDDDDEDNEDNEDNEMEEMELHCSLCESEVCVFRGMKGHLSMHVQNANAAATSISFSSSSLKSVSVSQQKPRLVDRSRNSMSMSSTKKKPKPSKFNSKTKKAANKSLDQAIELLGDSLHDSSSIEIWRTLQQSTLGWKYVKGDLTNVWLYLLPSVSKMKGVLRFNMFSSVDNLVNTLKQRHEELFGSKSSTILAAKRGSSNRNSSGGTPASVEQPHRRSLPRTNNESTTTSEEAYHAQIVNQQQHLLTMPGVDDSCFSSTIAAAAGVRRESPDEDFCNSMMTILSQQSDEELLQHQQAALKQHEIEAEHVCSVCQEIMSWNSICVPALLVCGHVSTCVSCYEKWNNGKLVKLCPICKITQTISPIRVDLGYTSLDEPRFSLDVTYLTRVTQQKTPIIILCTLSSTGEEIKKSATKILLDQKIDYPEEFQSLTFRTQKKTFHLHGNTTLYDIGFQKSSHALYIQEDELPINHKFIQERLEKMEKSPDTKFKIRLRAAKGLELSDINVIVEKQYTIKELMQNLNRYLMGKYYTSIVGKKLTISFPRIGVLLDDKLTLGELRINTTSRVMFTIFD